MVLDLGFGHTFPSFSNFHLIRPVSFCFEAPQVMISASKAIAGLLAMARNSNIDSKEAAARAMFYLSSHASGVQAIAAAGPGDGFVQLVSYAFLLPSGKQTSVKGGIRTLFLGEIIILSCEAALQLPCIGRWDSCLRVSCEGQRKWTWIVARNYV